MQLLLCSNVFDGVTDSEICEFYKNTIWISQEQNSIFFSSNKKIINYMSRATLWQQINTFLAEVTFKWITKRQIVWTNYLDRQDFSIAKQEKNISENKSFHYKQKIYWASACMKGIWKIMYIIKKTKKINDFKSAC